jgi:hypothetical protein
MAYYLVIILGKRFMNSLVETENLIALIFYKLKGQCMQVAAIPEETVKDVNARITLDKSTASENNIVNNYDKWSNNLNDNNVSVRAGGSCSSESLLC